MATAEPEAKKEQERQTLSCRTQDMQKSHTRTPTHIYAHKCVYTHTHTMQMIKINSLLVTEEENGE